MLNIADKEFEKMISDAIDSLPEDRIKGLNNIAITYEDQPTKEQHVKLKLRGNQTLYGLYEGIPLTKRASASSLFSGMPMTMPDKITIFKLPIVYSSTSIDEVRETVRHTLWHEIAHYYGLDHDQISRLE
jgi:predicted Zn-dependent protease with MMP-like domain